MSTRNLPYNIGKPAFKIVNGYKDAFHFSAGTLFNPSTTYVNSNFLFTTYPTTSSIVPIDEAGVTHKTVNYGIVQTRPKIKLRYIINWDEITVGTVVGGLVTDIKEYEFLTYLLNNHYRYSLSNIGSLYFRLGNDSEYVFGDAAQDYLHRVYILSIEPYRAEINYAHCIGYKLVMDTEWITLPNSFSSTIMPYTYTPNRRR